MTFNSNLPSADVARADQPLTAPATRIASVDALRGLTILLMVFVNDLGSAAPSWMHHIQPPDADGMTLADIVFPFFLFIAGVSIPLAVEASRRKGFSNVRLLGHVLTRTLGLLLMGLVGVNRIDQTSTSPELWGLLAYLAIILAWLILPSESGLRRTLLLSLKWLGIVGLLVLLAIYRRDGVSTEVLFVGTVEDWTWLRTQWWGILGLIGWAYLVAACIYLLVGSRREWLIAATALLMSSYVVANQGGYFTRLDDKPWLDLVRPALDGFALCLNEINAYVSLSTQLGTLPAIVVSGCVLGTLLLSSSDITDPRKRIGWALTYAGWLFLAGLVTDTFGGVNKIAATPTWCFWCASLAAIAWAGLYWLMDVKGMGRWLIAIRPAGANPLIAYLLHPILLFTLALTGVGGSVRSYATSDSAWIAVFGSVGMAAVVCGLTGLVARVGLRVRI